jgi:DNA-binding PadR family transcriptional regulator
MPARRNSTNPPTPDSFLPIPKDVFHILVSLADRDRHGYSVLQDVADRTGGEVRLSPSSLYSSIRRLLEQGLIKELDERPDNDDQRRRYYHLTKLGRAVALAEARRMERLLENARAVGLIRGQR